MTAQAALQEAVRRRIQAEGLGPLAARTGLGIGQLRSIRGGRAPLLSTVQQAADALDLELCIRPRGGADLAQSTPYARSAPPLTVAPRPDQVPGAPVRDRGLATLLAAIVSHWEALESRYARDTWIADLYRWCPALSAQRSALSQIVAWLGWRVVERAGGRKR